MTMRRLAACLLGLALPLASQASSSLASEMGCYNCHGQPTRAAAPSFERLAAKYAKHKDDAKAEQHEVDGLLRGEPFQRIPAHEHLSAETARRLVHWLFEGAK
jgi:cytochrome c